MDSTSHRPSMFVEKLPLKPCLMASQALSSAQNGTSAPSFTILTGSIACCFRLSRKVLTVARRPSILSIRKLRENHLQRLRSAGIDVAAAERTGGFGLRNWGDAYLHDDAISMRTGCSTLIQEVLEGGAQQGFALTRLVAHMEWALEDFPGVDDLVEYRNTLELHLATL